MWDDVFNEDFVDTLILLAIPGLAILGTIVVALFVTVCRKKKPEEIPDSPTLHVIEEAEYHQNRIKFGLEQS